MLINRKKNSYIISLPYIHQTDWHQMQVMNLIYQFLKDSIYRFDPTLECHSNIKLEFISKEQLA